jgi:hypothetical protein
MYIATDWEAPFGPLSRRIVDKRRSGTPPTCGEVVAAINSLEFTKGTDRRQMAPLIN